MFFHDTRYAFRSISRQPTFAAMAILTLVLGIGANTAIFGVVKAVLLNRLPYEKPSGLVVLWEQNPNGSPDLVAPLTFKDWQSQSRAIESMAAYRSLRYAFAGSPVKEDPLDVPSIRATPNLFGVLGVNAMLGRTFLPEEGVPGADHVAMLSRAFWERHFGGAPSIIGRTIQLDAQPYTVVGIMAANFDFPPSDHIDIWTPLSFDPNDAHGRSRKGRSLSVVGRLASGVPREQAQREMSLIASRLGVTYADSNAGWGARVISAQEQLVTTVRPALLLITAAVGFLLLIVCANVANLLLARISSRRTELAVRAALGAGRGQLVRQVLAESFVLSGIGGALGVLVAWAGVRFVHALPEGSLPRMNDVRLDAGVLLFAVVVSLVVALIFGLVPALQASRAGLRDTVGAFGTTTAVSGTRVLSALIVVEVALALVLLVGAGLMTRSFAQLMRVSPGFGIDFALPFTIEGKAAPTNGEEPRADIRIATPRYFETMKIPMVKGRSIDERDLPGRPGAMVINETMARRYFPGEDPIGRVVRGPHGTAEVVGISGDVKHYGLDGGPRAELFMPAWQQPLNGMAFVVRTASDPTNFIEPIRRSIAAIDAEQPIFDSSAMVDVVARSVFLPRISMVLLATFAALALVLAVVGIFGVVSYSVAERTREIGVRMALGANAGDTLRLVLGRSMALVAAGTVVGLIAAVALTRAITGLLYEVSPLDPIVFVGVSIVLAAAGLLASVIPARRATRVDPLVALRVQ
ncbi:MAG: permease [Acidobacteria bacterium]|nr:MAG: permease [Acidobacteriota bacterium]